MSDKKKDAPVGIEKQPDPGVDSQQSSIEKARRDMLKRLGKYGAYTAPTMLSIMVADKAAAASGGGIAPPSPSGPTATSTG